MGKKKKRTSKRSKPKKPAPSRIAKQSKYPLMALTCGVVVLGIGLFYLLQNQPPQNPAGASLNDAQVKTELRETRPTQPPAKYKGAAGAAYTIARAIPEVLDQLYCYCRCRETFGHKNLLTCYVDNHAAT